MKSIFISGETYKIYLLSMFIITYITQKLLKTYKDKLLYDSIFYGSNMFVLILIGLNSWVSAEGMEHQLFWTDASEYLKVTALLMAIWQIYIFAFLCTRDKYKVKG